MSRKVSPVVMVLVIGFMLPGLAKAGSPPGGRPLSSLAGTYSYTGHGNYAYCTEPTSPYAEESCATPGAIAFPITGVDVGQATIDQNGNGCDTITETDSDLVPGISATTISPLLCVDKITSYDARTQSGDESYVCYSSGKCVGAQFEASGTPVIVATGTYHIVLSANGTRLDWEITSLSDPTGGLADFAYSGTEFQQ